MPRTVARKEAPRTVDLDESPASTPRVDSTGSFEQGDPLAEADFHMAYGLYDQAADLVKLAIGREPARRDLKLKLLEVYFVWGNKEQFLLMARDLGATRDAAQPGEWEKVVIMGKQLAPEDPLFTQSYGGVGPSSVDLNLEGGQNLVDFDLPSESSTRLPALADGAAAGAWPRRPGFRAGRSGPRRGRRQRDHAGHAAGPQQVLRHRWTDHRTCLSQSMARRSSSRRWVSAIRWPASSVHRAQPLGSTDQTAEPFTRRPRARPRQARSHRHEPAGCSQLIRALDSSDPENSETLVAGLDDTARHLLEQAGATQATELLPLSDLGGATSRVAALDLNFEVESDAETGKRATPDFSLDLDVGSAEQTVDGEYQRTQRIDQVTVSDIDATQRDLEPVSMSEVGTKLDLARAYMDMGDPDGARSILGEVLLDGPRRQRQEAQRLLDSIPG